METTPSQDNEEVKNTAPTGDEESVPKVKSNRNFLVAYIYGQTSDISEKRTLLRYREVMSEQITESISKVAMQIVPNPEMKRDIREMNEHFEKQKKSLENQEEENEKTIDSLKENIESKCHIVEMAQLELKESIKYEQPASV